MSDLRDRDSGLYGDAFFRASLQQRVAAARRLLRPFSVVLVDLASTTPAVARTVGAALRQTLRESDTACRLAGGGFGVLLEDTSETGAIWSIERVRRAFVQASTVTPVMWAAVASYPAHALTADELLAIAETALRHARDWPQGRIEVAGTVE